MSDEISMANQIDALKEKLDKIEGENTELKEQNTELKEQNTELKEQIAVLKDKNSKLLEEIETMKMEKFQNEQTKQIASNSISQKILKHKSTDSEEKMDAKRAKMEGKSVPNWLTEVLAWIKRVEMADSKLSTSSWTFKQLCWPKLHLNVKPHRVDYLKIEGERNESTGIIQSKLEGLRKVDLPIASMPPPKYITGFDWIYIDFLDGRIMQFIGCIHPLLNGFSLIIRNLEIPIPIFHSVEQITQIRRLFIKMVEKASSICHENLMNILRFNRNAIENVQSLQNVRLVHKEEIDFLIRWLVKSRPDTKPKMISSLNFYVMNSIFFERFTEQFLGSTHSANFIISLELEPDYAIFDMENEQTGEVLALYPNLNRNENDFQESRQFLVRHAKGQEYLRADWEKQIKQLDNLPRIIINIQGIGDF